MYEELSVRKLKVKVEPDYSQRSDIRWKRDCLYGSLQSSMETRSKDLLVELKCSKEDKR